MYVWNKHTPSISMDQDSKGSKRKKYKKYFLPQRDLNFDPLDLKASALQMSCYVFQPFEN